LLINKTKVLVLCLIDHANRGVLMSYFAVIMYIMF